MRELQLWSGDLSNTFEDIEELALKCKFSDCSHQNEPGCAVRNAMEIGQLSEERFERYKKLNKELRYIENKRVLSAKRAEKQKIIDMMGSLDMKKKVKNR
jgi:ribosome biogenesis GTPase